MTRFLKNNDGVLLLLGMILLVVVSFGRVIFLGVPAFESRYLLGMSSLEAWQRWLIFALNFPIAAFLLVLFNRMVQQYGLLTRLSNLPFFLSILAFFTIQDELNQPFIWFSLACLMWFYTNNFEFMSTNGPKTTSFWSGFSIGLGSWLYPAIILSLPTYIQAGFSSGMLSMRRFIIHLVGVLLPSYFIILLYYLIADDWILPNWFRIDFKLSISNWGFWQWALVVFIQVITVVSTGFTLKGTNLREKRRFYLLAVSSILSLLAGVFISFDVFVIMSLLPFSIVFSRWIQAVARNWVGDLVLLTYLMIIIGLNL